jgi:hypothetical protein
MVALALEVFVTRLLAYTVHTFLLYLVLGVAMTGFGAAGSLVAVRQRWLEAERLPRALAAFAVGFVLALVLAYATFVRLAPGLRQSADLGTFAVSALLTLPFLAAGAVVTLALSAAGDALGRVYAADLIGSGLGCFLPLLLLGPLDGQHFLALLALVGWISAALFFRRVTAPGLRLKFALGGSLVVAVLGFVFAGRVFPVQPEPYGQVGIIARYAQKRGFSVQKLFDRWNMVGRVEVYEYHHVPGTPDPYPFRFYAQDNTAGAVMARWDGRDQRQVGPDQPSPSPVPRMCSQSLFGQAYFAPRKKVLVIGVGGGADVQCALYNDASHVDAVEINPAAIRAIRGPFNHWLGGIGSDPRVRYVIRDGRSFARAARGHDYDLIQLSGVDTKSILASGSLALSENHLYTRRAFIDYLSSLSDHGVLSLIRFGQGEALRLVNTAVVALGALGVEHPSQHLLVLDNGLAYGVIVSRQPLTPDAVRAFYQRFWFTDHDFRGFKAIFLEPFGYVPTRRPQLVYEPGRAVDPLFAHYFAALGAGRRAAFQKGYPFNIAPTTDDRPFFFDLTRYDLPSRSQAPHVPVLERMLSSVLLLAGLMILLPLSRIHDRMKGLQAFLVAVFFGSVGLAYLFFEIWFIHRFAMFLGHQSYSLSVVLATLLGSTGAGAFLGSRLSAPPHRRVIYGVAGAFGVLALWLLVLPSLFEAAWTGSLALRAAVAIAFVAPAGLAMGLPFPAGLDWVSRRRPAVLPWCVGVNFFASVVATTAAIPMSLVFGYHVVLAWGAALYLVCAVVAAAFWRP